MMKTLAAALMALGLTLPLATQVQAQDVPTYATQPISTDENIHGRITSFDGGYNLGVRDERGFLDNVRLHPGTVINPTGLTLAPGMIVSILGYNAGGYFSANQIDTPYSFYGGVPYYAGHPWNYYGPSISLGFFFGSAGWWHGGYFGGGYRYVGGARVYNHARVSAIYQHQGGEFHGRNFVARPERGGYYGHGAEHAMSHMGGGHEGGGHGGGHMEGGHGGGHGPH